MPTSRSKFVIDSSTLESQLFNAEIQQYYLMDEDTVLENLLDSLHDYPLKIDAIVNMAYELVQTVRAHKHEQTALDAFMHEYDLSSEEGVTLMCIAEALLRIPDNETAERLIEDKLAHADWGAHVGKSHSLFVNASTWGLMLTGRIINLDNTTRNTYLHTLNHLVKRSGEPVIKLALKQAMGIMSLQFVMGKTINAALKRSLKPKSGSELCSFDMLGEAAITDEDATHYLQNYLNAIKALSSHQQKAPDMHHRSSLSVKLSALHPHYNFTQIDTLMIELLPRFKALAVAARDAGISLTMDAEEADRLEISLALFISLCRDPDLKNWNGLGLAVQAYQKRALAVLKWLAIVAEETGRVIPLRLVKGAYWDTEIKLAQETGVDNYPVFTRKVNTDVSYLACTKFLLDRRTLFYPQLATHNAHTIAATLIMAGNHQGYEFQRLHGMGDQLYHHLKQQHGDDIRCRVYAPVGSHKDLLPYLVRRLLENGANTSFVNRIVDDQQPVASVICDPMLACKKLDTITNPAIPLPGNIFGETRKNSRSLNLANFDQQHELALALSSVNYKKKEIGLVSSVTEQSTKSFPIESPQDHRKVIGHWHEPTSGCVDQVLEQAFKAQSDWDNTAVNERANCLEKAANLVEKRRHLFIRLCVEEAGKTIPDAIAEVREAVDFCRYYAVMARKQQGSAQRLVGPTGETNELFLHGRGTFVCISPWNFPLAIFTGQVTAALVCGNCVIAKPAEQTNMIAWHAVQCLHEAGIPNNVLHLVPGRGQTVGAQLTASNSIAGVAFTGSSETAHLINQTLASRTGPLATLIAETGGQNAMLVDSSALPEQVVKDVLLSAFGSSGQRCSALRVLFLQKEIADRVINLLSGAMKSLVPGDPAMLKTDVGPVIDNDALHALNEHIDWLEKNAKLIAKCSLPEGMQHGTFVAPHAFEIKRLAQLCKEHFGPILHIIRFNGKDMDKVIGQINQSGYGLTLGIHSRIEKTWLDIQSRVRVGNCYINRNMIGAMVGVQPFGGEGLSGTGPKAGGPHYLYRFVTERVRTINTAAVGGNATLLSMGE